MRAAPPFARHPCLRFLRFSRCLIFAYALIDAARRDPPDYRSADAHATPIPPSPTCRRAARRPYCAVFIIAAFLLSLIFHAAIAARYAQQYKECTHATREMQRYIV